MEAGKLVKSPYPLRTSGGPQVGQYSELIARLPRRFPATRFATGGSLQIEVPRQIGRSGIG